MRNVRKQDLVLANQHCADLAAGYLLQKQQHVEQHVRYERRDGGPQVIWLGNLWPRGLTYQNSCLKLRGIDYVEVFRGRLTRITLSPLLQGQRVSDVPRRALNQITARHRKNGGVAAIERGNRSVWEWEREQGCCQDGKKHEWKWNDSKGRGRVEWGEKEDGESYVSETVNERKVGWREVNVRRGRWEENIVSEFCWDLK